MAQVKEKTVLDREKLIDQTIEKFKEKMPETFTPTIQEAFKKIQSQGLSPCEAMGISKEVVEKIYGQGYFFFQSGKFKDALSIFNVLTQLVGGADPRFTFAIAACHHHMKNYIDAGGYYMLYDVLNPGNPLAYYHLYDCFKNSGNPTLAIGALENALKLTLDNPKYKKLQTEIEIDLKNLKAKEEEVQA